MVVIVSPQHLVLLISWISPNICQGSLWCCSNTCDSELPPLLRLTASVSGSRWFFCWHRQKFESSYNLHKFERTQNWNVNDGQCLFFPPVTMWHMEAWIEAMSLWENMVVLQRVERGERKSTTAPEHPAIDPKHHWINNTLLWKNALTLWVRVRARVNLCL